MGSSIFLIVLGMLSLSTASNITREGRGALLDHIKTKFNFAAEKMGLIECKGADGYTGGHLFEHILGQGADFGGDYLCEPTCGGNCIPNKAIRDAPVSLYPFGCQCSVNRCSRQGPIIHPLAKPQLKIVCVRDERCTCAGMTRYRPGSYQAPLAPTDVGYLCNWINRDNNQEIAYQTGSPDPSFKIHPTYSPIRWCSCCPQVYSGY